MAPEAEEAARGTSRRSEHKFRARALVRELRRRGPTAVDRLAQSLGVGESTLRHTIDFLRADRGCDIAVLENHTLRLRADVGILAGVEVTGSTATAAIAPLDFKEPDVESTEIAIGQPEQSLSEIAALIARMLARDPYREQVAERLVGIGVALPGPILREPNTHPPKKDASEWNRLPETGTILPGWDGFNVGAALATLLMEEHGIFPPRWKKRRFVWVENDASAGALGVFSQWSQWDLYRDQVPEGVSLPELPEDLIYVRLTSGIGAGIINKGHLLTGAHGFAGEFGHAVADPGGRLCPVCGARGCLETVASDRVLTEHLRAVLTASRTDHHDLVEASITRGLEPLLRAKHPAVDRALRDGGTHVGEALASVCTMLDPSCIVLGGIQAEHISQSSPDERPFVKAFEAALRSRTISQVAKPERLAIMTWSELSNDPDVSAELLGALALVVDHLGDGYLLKPVEAWMDGPRQGRVSFAAPDN